MDTSVIFSQLTSSFYYNTLLFVITLVFALPLGLVVAFGSMSRFRPFGKKSGPFREFRPIRTLTQTIVWMIRGTPLMLQIIIIFYGPGLLGFGHIWGPGTTGRLVAASMAFIVNYACYFSEIYRGGIESIPKGQYEAGQVLGMTKSQIFVHVTLKQVIKRIVPPMGNEFMTLIKDSALANIIMVKEIITMSKEFATKGLIWPLFSTAIYFLVFCGILTLLFNWLEKRMNYFKA